MSLADQGCGGCGATQGYQPHTLSRACSGCLNTRVADVARHRVIGLTRVRERVFTEVLPHVPQWLPTSRTMGLFAKAANTPEGALDPAKRWSGEKPTHYSAGQITQAVPSSHARRRPATASAAPDEDEGLAISLLYGCLSVTVLPLVVRAHGSRPQRGGQASARRLAGLDTSLRAGCLVSVGMFGAPSAEAGALVGTMGSAASPHYRVSRCIVRSRAR